LQKVFYNVDKKGNLVPNNFLLSKLKDKAALFNMDSEEFKKFSNSSYVNATLNAAKLNNTSMNNSNNTINNNTKNNTDINSSQSQSDLLNKKLEKEGIKLQYSKDANGNDIVSFSPMKQGECTKNPTGQKITLPKPANGKTKLSKAPNPFLKDEIEEDPKSCDKDDMKIPTIEGECDKNDIYCLCRNHPQYKDCVCLAYPKSIICNNNYCVEHKDSYECNPSQCDKEPNCENCYCKNNMDDVKCKCKVNPYDRECFCLQYPLSHLCNEKACKINPNTLYCSCKTSLKEKMCTPRYCFDNPTNIYCKCIVNPLSPECKCMNDPTLCDSKINLVTFRENIHENYYQL
jgi:hypothetical protein